MTKDEQLRYSRHMIMPEVGAEGQRRLNAARVLCIGAGGLGSPAALYLAAAGIGQLGLVDDDTVSLSNLQRQILFRTADTGRSKVEAGRDALTALNPNVLVNDTCYFARKTLVSAAVTEFEGQLATYKGHLPDLPCYRCLFPEPPPPNTVRSCSETGVLGAAAGVMGALQALEVLKEAAGLGTGLAGRVLTYKALSAEFRTA